MCSDSGLMSRPFIWCNVWGAAALALCVSAAPLQAQTREDHRKRCAGFNDNADHAIGGCTALIQSGTESNEGLAWAFVNRGNAYDNNGDHERALRDYDTALGLVPTYASAFFNRGITYWGIGDLDRALAAENRAIELDSRYASAFVWRATVFVAQGEYDKALADLDEARRIGLGGVTPPIDGRERDARAAAQAGQRCANASADPDLRIGSCTAVVRDVEKLTVKARARANNFRGIALSAKRDFEASFAAYSEAARLDPSQPVYFSNRGLVAIWAERYDDAAASFEQALKLDPQHATALNGQGLLARQRGDYRTAVEKFTAAMRMTPTSAPFVSNRGIAYLLAGDLDKALVDLNAALAINPNEPYALYARGVLKRRRGDVAGGDADMAAAKKLQTDVVTEMKRRHVEGG
jgi:tetratricopeptide (TPR) repeat protein